MQLQQQRQRTPMLQCCHSCCCGHRQQPIAEPAAAGQKAQLPLVLIALLLPSQPLPRRRSLSWSTRCGGRAAPPLRPCLTWPPTCMIMFAAQPPSSCSQCRQCCTATGPKRLAYLCESTCPPRSSSALPAAAGSICWVPARRASSGSSSARMVMWGRPKCRVSETAAPSCLPGFFRLSCARPNPLVPPFPSILSVAQLRCSLSAFATFRHIS